MTGIPIIGGGRAMRMGRVQAPHIFGIEELSVGETTATIGWNTTIPATSQIQYGETTAYGSETTLSETLTTGHTQSITGLTAATVYHYRCVSTGQGHTVYSEDGTFETDSLDACVISNVAEEAVTDESCTITWDTDIAATSQIEYGATDEYGSETTLNSNLTLEHSETITGLEPDTTYHYRCVSVANAQTTNSADGTFTTDEEDVPEEGDPTPYVVPAYSLPTGGTTWEPTTGAEFQTALTNSVQGDVIVLDKDTTYTTTNGGRFWLMPKADNGKWLYIITSDMVGLPAEGTRVAESDATSMPKVTAYGSTSNAAIYVEEGCNKVRFVGLEMTTNHTGTANQNEIIRIGRYTWPGYPSSTHATDIIVDRCYIHGDGYVGDGVVTSNVSGCAIIESHIDNIKSTSTETHGVLVHHSYGPTLIRNCFIEAAGINVFVGDSGTPTYDSAEGDRAFARDVTVTGNHTYKPTSWNPAAGDYGGTEYAVKNHLEVKEGSRIVFEDNYMQNCWAGQQYGMAVNIKSVGWHVTDVVVRNNFIRNCAMLANVGAQHYGGSSGIPPQYVRRIVIENNLLIEGAMSPYTAYIFQFTQEADCELSDVTVRHNTCVYTTTNGGIALLAALPSFTSGFTFSDNIVCVNGVGFFANGRSSGYDSYTNGCPGAIVKNNVAIENGAFSIDSRYSTNGDWGPWYDVSNPVHLDDVGFVDHTGTDIADWALGAGSAYNNAATDGTDIGCDVTALSSVVVGGE